MNTHILYKKGRESRTIQGGQMADEAVDILSLHPDEAGPRPGGPVRACWRCGSGRLAADWDGELRCLSCGRTPPADQTPAAVARLTGLSPRTIARWIDAGLVAASSPRGSGRPRLVDTGGVIRLVAERRTLERRSARGAGRRSRRQVSQRASRATRLMVQRARLRGASAHQGGRNPYRTGPRRGGVVLTAIGRAERAAMAIRHGKD